MSRPKGGYRNKEHVSVIGVTTILSRFKESGALMHWAFKQGQLKERGEIEHLYDSRDKAGAIGTATHEMTDAFLHDNDPEEVLLTFLPVNQFSDSDRTKARNGYQMFLEWWNSTKLLVYKSEIPLVSEQYQFGGCPDWVLETPKGLAIGDIKTSNGVYVDYLLQLAAYRQLWEENYPNEPITGGFHLCRFAKEHADFSHHYWSELDEAWEQFKLFRAAYDHDKALKRRAA